MAEAALRRRQAAARTIMESQRATSAAIYALHDTIKAPVPFKAYAEVPDVSGPVPTDDHLAWTRDPDDVRYKAPLPAPTFTPEVTALASDRASPEPRRRPSCR